MELPVKHPEPGHEPELYEPLIDLPKFEVGMIYKRFDKRLFYSTDGKGKCIIPPEAFGDICDLKNNLNRLRQPHPSDKKKYILTAVGDEWTTLFWDLFPFFDPTQRDALGRPEAILRATPENKLKFVSILIDKLGSHDKSPFVSHIRNAIDTYVSARVNEDVP